ncbi:MAG TPA: hypothetical protein VH561_23190 [Micromonosporaceae bacterium]|jgi:hypothetical protein
MAPRHSKDEPRGRDKQQSARDEQPRSRWPVNPPADQQPRTGREAGAGGAFVSPLESRPAGQHAAPEPQQQRIDQSKAASTARPSHAASNASGGGTATIAGPPGDVDFSTYVQRSLQNEGRYGIPAGPDQAPPRSDRARADDRARFARVGYGSLYQSDQARADAYDDTVLGLNYTAAAPRVPVADERWASSLRGFARAAVWLLPVAVILLALSGVFGWPTNTTEPSLVSPGTWVVVTALGLGLWLVGVAALAALAATSRVRQWGSMAVVASALGVAMLGPVVGAVGFGRPAIHRTALSVENDPNIAGAAGQMQQSLLSNAAARWLLVAGVVLLAIGVVAVAVTILGSRVLQRHDGWLMLIGIGIAIVAAFLSWNFLLPLAAMVMLAGALGLAYTVSRIAPDGTPPPAY